MPLIVSNVTKNQILIVNDCFKDLELRPDFFSPAFLADNQLIQSESTGRGKVYFFQLEQTRIALRHYRRGGLMAKMSEDSFLWSSLEKTRVYAELQLLETMATHGLPTPMPVTGLITRNGPTYNADIMTQVIEDSSELHQILQSKSIPAQTWSEIGRQIRKMHNLNICHDDINVKNVLLTTNYDVHLIDFDKCYQRPGGSWKQANLNRFRRSLQKLTSKYDNYHWQEKCWEDVLSGYSID